MSTAFLHPGDTLQVSWSQEATTPFGKKTITGTCAFTYDELLAKLSMNGQGLGKSRRSKTKGAKFSRHVSLCFYAICNGKWPTGSKMSRDDALDRLFEGFNTLDETEYKNITKRANGLFDTIYRDYCRTLEQKEEVFRILVALGFYKQK